MQVAIWLVIDGDAMQWAGLHPSKRAHADPLAALGIDMDPSFNPNPGEWANSP